MKKLLIFLILFTFPLIGQTIKDIGNSTTTTLDSAEVFTGYRKDVTAYNSVTVSCWSDDTVTVAVQFGDLVSTVFTVQRYFEFTYLANDTTWTKSMPVVAPFYRVVATNAIDDSMTVFRLTSMLHKGHSLPVDTNAYISVAVEASALLDSIEVNLEETNTLLEQIETEELLIGIDVDSTLANVKEGNTLLEQIETEELLIGIDVDSTLTNVKESNYLLQDVDNNTDMLETKGDTTIANIQESNYLLQDIDNNTDLVETKLDSIEVNLEEANALLQSIEDNTDAMEAGLDSVEVNIEELNGLTQSIETNTDSILVNIRENNTLTEQIETELLLIGIDTDSTLANVKESNYLLQDIDTNTDGLEAKSDSIEVNIEEGNALSQTLINNTNTVEASLDSIEVNIEELNTLTESVKGLLTAHSTFGYGANAITVVEQLAADQACKKVIITNFTSGEIIYVGGDNSTSTANGFPLAYMDSMTLTVSNLNKVWLISDGTSVDIRYVYEN